MVSRFAGCGMEGLQLVEDSDDSAERVARLVIIETKWNLSCATTATVTSL